VSSERWSNVRELTIQDAARMMWGVLQTHVLMEHFLLHEFQGYPKLATYSISYLFRNRLSPRNLEGLSDKIDDFKGDVKGNSTTIGKLVKKHGVWHA
jgi:hypothetical protein